MCDPQGSPTRLRALGLLRQDLNVAWWRVFNALVGARAVLAGRAPSRLARARLLKLLAKETAEVYDIKGQSVPCPEAKACEAAPQLYRAAIEPRADVTADAEALTEVHDAG